DWETRRCGANEGFSASYFSASPRPRVSASLLHLFHHREHVAAVHRCAYLNIQRHDDSCFGRFHFVLHLHSFDYQDAGAGVDLFADSYQDAHHLAGHWRDDVRSFDRVRVNCLCTAQTFGIRDGERITIRADNHVECPAGLGPAFDPTIEDLAIRDEQVTATVQFENLEFVAATVNVGTQTRAFSQNLNVGLIITDRGT